MAPPGMRTTYGLLIVSLHPVWQARIIPADLTLHNYVRTLFFWAPDHISAA